MAKLKHLDHATHNHNVCDYLNKEKSYNDWIVISAFYSALHFVSHKVFPIKMKTDAGKKYIVETIEEYINVQHGSNNVPYKGKHYVLVELLIEKSDKALGSKYRRLLELSKLARYTDYNVDPEIADFARKTLGELKLHCNS